MTYMIYMSNPTSSRIYPYPFSDLDEAKGVAATLAEQGYREVEILRTHIKVKRPVECVFEEVGND